jgi:DNA polymerase-3 subunit gamma/tau
MSLHIDYRPKTFDEFVGNIATVKSLQALLESKDCPHTFLFHGKAGCGKTTLARIVAKQVGCSENDVYEYNSANTRGIDTARDIIQTAPYSTLNGKNKCYILDEAHKTTSDFQNAILKILEEPPAHVYFVLCTTNPEKLLTTVKSRCTSFKVSPLPDNRLVRLLSKASENIPENILEKIAEKVEGVPRDALILLNKVKDLKPERMEKAIETLPANEEKTVIDLCRLLNQKASWNKITETIKALEMETESIRRIVLSYFEKVLLGKNDPNAAIIIECFEKNFYDSGRAGLLLACYKAIF